MPIKLEKQTAIGLWTISNELKLLCVLDDDDMKSLGKQFKEAGF